MFLSFAEVGEKKGIFKKGGSHENRQEISNVGVGGPGEGG